MKRSIILLTTLCILVNMLTIPAYANENAVNTNIIETAYIKTSEYTVGKGYILGVAEDMNVDDFLSQLECSDTPVVYAGNSDDVRTDKIKNGDTVVVSNKKYVI